MTNKQFWEEFSKTMSEMLQTDWEPAESEEAPDANYVNALMVVTKMYKDAVKKEP